MSLLFAESWDYLAISDVNKQWLNDAGVSSIVPNAGRCGTAAYRNTSVGAGPSISLPNTDSHFYVGVAYNPEFLLQGNNIYIKDLNGHVILQAVINVDGSISIWRGPNLALGTLLGSTAPGLVGVGSYEYVEFGGFIDAATGTAEIRVNRVSALTVGPTNTQTNIWESITVPWTLIKIEVQGYIDDVYIGNGLGSAPNNTFLGNVHVEAEIAEADSIAAGFYNGFTPLTGTDHGAMVMDNPEDGDTTYNASATPGLRDSYRYPNLVNLTGATIYGVMMSLCTKISAAAARTASSTVRVGGVTYDGTAQGITTDYKYYREMYELNPNTGTAWTSTTVNALDAGIKDVA